MSWLLWPVRALSSVLSTCPPETISIEFYAKMGEAAKVTAAPLVFGMYS